jgi:hypothetical protein
VENLLVLGLIPGTNLQITFFPWLIGAAILIAFIAVRSLRGARLLCNWVIALRLYTLSRRSVTL